jgi:hypothetical protein
VWQLFNVAHAYTITTSHHDEPGFIRDRDSRQHRHGDLCVDEVRDAEPQADLNGVQAGVLLAVNNTCFLRYDRVLADGAISNACILDHVSLVTIGWVIRRRLSNAAMSSSLSTLGESLA